MGCPRSGTSVLSWSIAAHTETWLGPESDFMKNMFPMAKEMYAMGITRRDKHWLSGQNVSEDELIKYLGEGINALYTNRSGGKRWIEQTPLYSLFIDDIGRAFPDAKFVHILRDGRQVVNSMINSGFDTKWSNDFKFACKTWARYVNELMEFGDKYPERIYILRMEKLLANPIEEMKSLSRYLNLEFEDEMTDLIVKKKRINSSFKGGTAKKEWQDSWTNRQCKQFDKMCGELLLDLGYVDQADWVDKLFQGRVQRSLR